MIRSGIEAEGEAPGCWRAIRTRRTEREYAEPKGRAEDERLAVDAGGDRALGADLELGSRPLTPWPLPLSAACGGRGGDRDSEQAVVDVGPGPGPDRHAEPVEVVGNEDRSPGRVLGAARPGPLEVGPLPLGPERVGQGVEDRPQLRVPIALLLYRLRIEAERDVVDEHPAVDLSEVNPALAPVDERVERADDVIAVYAEIQREVVAGPGWDTRVRKIELGRDRGNHRLRAVAACHRQPVGAAPHGVADELLEVGPPGQLDRFDPTRPRLVCELELLGLPSPGLRVEEERRVRRRHRVGERDPGDEGGPGRGEGTERRRADDERLRDATVEDHEHHDRQHQQRRAAHPHDTSHAAANQPVPCANGGGDQQGGDDRPARKLGDHGVGGNPECQPAQSDCQACRQPGLAHQTSLSTVRTDAWGPYCRKPFRMPTGAFCVRGTQKGVTRAQAFPGLSR